MKKELVKLRIDTDGTAWHGITAERVWATQVGVGLYRIENSPLYAYGVSYMDVVVASEDADHELRFEGVHGRGGHSTYRVVLREGLQRSAFERLWQPIQDLRCTYESSRDSETVFAIDVPPTADVHAVCRLLEEGEVEHVWEFEEGHCGHPIEEVGSR